MKNLPEQKELNALAELKDEYNDLAEPEQFGVVVCIGARINCRVPFWYIGKKKTNLGIKSLFARPAVGKCYCFLVNSNKKSLRCISEVPSSVGSR